MNRLAPKEAKAFPLFGGKLKYRYVGEVVTCSPLGRDFSRDFFFYLDKTFHNCQYFLDKTSWSVIGRLNYAKHYAQRSKPYQ